MDYRYGSHTVYNIEYHFVWVTKYRYKVLTGDVALRVREMVRQTCELFEIKFLQGVVSKEQVLILLGPPEGVSLDQAEMEKVARRYWPQIKGNVTEVWVYPLGWNLFFTGPRLAEITQYLERD